jgi:hypothetical protein
MWQELFSTIWSNVLYFLARALKSNSLVARAAAADYLNYRAAYRNAHRNGADSTYLTLVIRATREGWALVEPMENGAAQFFAAVIARPKGSQAQASQDLFVQLALQDRRDGYFVEVGVGTGEVLSNTCMLERSYGWRGILAEPNPLFHESIRQNRSAMLDTRAVYSRRDNRAPHEVIKVATVSLTDLLREHGAPAVIDYISIDTEGSEFEILQGLDFKQFRPLVLTIEHSHDLPKLARIQTLLAGEGYRQVLAPLSQFDAFFLHETVVWP